MKLSPKNLLIGAAWLLSLAAAGLVGTRLAAGTTGTVSGTSSTGTPAGLTASPSLQTSLRDGATSSPRERGALGSNPGQTLTDLFRQPKGPGRTQRLLRLLDDLDPSEFPGFVDEFRQNPLSAVHQSDYDLILTAWVDRNPYAAAEYLESSDPGGRARETVIASWTAQDPAAAEAWIRNRPDEGPTNNWVVGFTRGLATDGTGKALALIEGLESGPTQVASIAAIAPFLVAEGPEAAHAWLAGLPADGPLLPKATQATARAFARHEVTAAAEWAEGLPDSATKREATREIAQVWATNNPSQALQWAGDLPPDTLSSAAEGIARQLTRTDPATTAGWLNSLGDSPELDLARHTFLGRVQSSHPVLALDSVTSLSDPGQQKRYYANILSRWSRNDQESATNWVVRNAETLPRDVVERYARTVKRQ